MSRSICFLQRTLQRMTSARHLSFLKNYESRLTNWTFHCRHYASTNDGDSSWPPHNIIKMPALSPTMQSGTLSKWRIAVGDEIEAGTTILADVETDKATMEWEAGSAEEGFLAKILVEGGTRDIPLGTVFSKLMIFDTFFIFLVLGDLASGYCRGRQGRCSQNVRL